jgi:hypothetical protein
MTVLTRKADAMEVQISYPEVFSEDRRPGGPPGRWQALITLGIGNVRLVEPQHPAQEGKAKRLTTG